MSLRYLDRSGRAIDAEYWAKKYRDKKYAIVERSRKGEQEIVTSWVGVSTGDERRPQIFVVQKRRRHVDGAGTRRREEIQESEVHWFADEEAALACHHKLEKESAPCKKG